MVSNLEWNCNKKLVTYMQCLFCQCCFGKVSYWLVGGGGWVTEGWAGVVFAEYKEWLDRAIQYSPDP